MAPCVLLLSFSQISSPTHFLVLSDFVPYAFLSSCTDRDVFLSLSCVASVLFLRSLASVVHNQITFFIVRRLCPSLTEERRKAQQREETQGDRHVFIVGKLLIF